MTTFMEPDWGLLLGDLGTSQMARLRDSITSLNISYSSSMCTQLTIEVIDPNFEMLASNYFLVGRDLVYRSKTHQAFGDMHNLELDANGNTVHLFEIASVEVRPSSGSSPMIAIQARTKAVQQMKRDKNPGNIKGKSHDYVALAGYVYGLKAMVEPTQKQRQITKASGDRQADSLWDVISSLASDAEFMLFETDGMLFFCSMDFLMGRWGVSSFQHSIFTNSRNETMRSPINVVPLIWPPFTEKDRLDTYYQRGMPFRDQITEGLRGDVKNTGLLIPMSMPVMRRSDNDPYLASGSASVDRTAGTMLRPGMTIFVSGIPTFTDVYMITSVSFDHFSTNPVSIEFSKPERKAKYIQTFEIGPVFSDYGTLTENSPLVRQMRVV